MYAIENFDFKRVRKVMKFLNWEWASEGVPTKESMKTWCWDLYENAFESMQKYSMKSSYCSSGGFQVVLSNQYDVELRFVLSDFEVEKGEIE
jgi:hypothetical protein